MRENHLKPFDETCDLLVAGLGFSGSFVTEALCRQLPGKKIIAIDKNQEILGLESSSMQECFKMHTGIHYAGDFFTAEQCLINSMKMADAFVDYTLDADNPKAPTRRGRHYLMSNSFVTEQGVRKLCEQLVETYRRELINYPKAKRVFGHPDEFITYLSPDEYSYISHSIPFETPSGKKENISVILGIETPECQIDIHKFRQYFNHIFVHYRDRVNLLYKHEVVDVSFSPDQLGYVIKTKYTDIFTGKAKIKKILTKVWVNCLWNNIEIFDQMLGHFAESERVNRLKILIRGPLPHSLKEINTCTFFSGPHVSITHLYDELGQDEAILTFEPVTNAGHYKAGTTKYCIEDQVVRDLISEPLSLEKEPGRSYATAIVQGVSKYITGFQDFKPTYIGLGFVKNFFMPYQEYLYDSNSPHNQRRQTGCENLDIGHISFAGMKMTYTFAVAQGVVRMVEKHLLVREIVRLLTRAILLELKNKDHQIDLNKIDSSLRQSLKKYILTQLRLDISKIDELNLFELSQYLTGLKKIPMPLENSSIVEKIADNYADLLRKKNNNLRFFITVEKDKKITGDFKKTGHIRSSL